MKKNAAKVVALIFLILLLLLGCDASTLPADIDPIGHIFRVEEIAVSNNPANSLDETPLFQIDVFGGFHIADNTQTNTFHSIGKLQKQSLEKTDPRKGHWLVSAEDTSETYELIIENDDVLTISKTVDSTIQWKYILDRVDTISANISSGSEKSSLELDWYFADVFSGDLSQLSGATIYGNGKVGIQVDDKDLFQITVYEDYYVDGVMEQYEYLLSEDDGFGFTVNTRSDSDKQYAIYRIPYENGEYVFYLDFLVK